MKNYNMILTEKLQKYKLINMNLTGEVILPNDQSRMIGQAKFTYSPLSKTFEKQIKTTEDQGEKQIKALEKHGKQLVDFSSEKDSLKLLTQNDIVNDFINERMTEI